MGLDMYLYAERYVPQYDFEKGANGKLERKYLPEYNQVDYASGMDTLPTAQYGGITVKKCVGYWRKANAVHGWIVRNCANGVDECQDIYMSRESLISLRDSCVNALANRDSATPAKDSVISFTENEVATPEVIMESMLDMFKQQSNQPETMVADPLSLEPVSGFFFGHTEKDEWYYKDLEYTVDTINSLLAGTDETTTFTYRASW